MSRNLSSLFVALAGQHIPGGCDHCDAYQTVTEDTAIPGIWHLTVHHDDTCPTWRRISRKAN